MASDSIEGLVFLLKAATACVFLVFWLRLLFECVVEEPPGRSKILWAAVIFFGSPAGALLYYFIRRPRRIPAA